VKLCLESCVLRKQYSIPHPAQCCPLLFDKPQLAESRSLCCTYLWLSHLSHLTDVNAENSTESFVGYPSGLGMCACGRSQLGAQTGDCYIHLSMFKDKSMYTYVFQNRIQKFWICALLKVLVCSSALALTAIGGLRVRSLARTEVLLITKTSRNPFRILPPGGKSARA